MGERELKKAQKYLANLGKKIYRDQARRVAEITLENFRYDRVKARQDAMDDIRYHLKTGGASSKRVEGALKKAEKEWEKEDKELSRKWLSPHNIGKIAQELKARGH